MYIFSFIQALLWGTALITPLSFFTYLILVMSVNLFNDCELLNLSQLIVYRTVLVLAVLIPQVFNKHRISNSQHACMYKQ